MTILKDGTKIRETQDNEFRADFPESMDLKITNWCDMAPICLWCHEASHTKGKHADLYPTVEALKALPAGVEIAIGGGNPLAHPHLKKFLKDLREIGLIPNLTVNELHLNEEFVPMLDSFIKEELIFGLGISYRKAAKNHEALSKIFDYPNTVLHLIAGVDDIDDIRALLPTMKTKKFLLLGYKDFRNGIVYRRDSGNEVGKNIAKWYNQLPLFINEVVNSGGIVSFDNLGIEQLNPKRLMNQQEWDSFYQGEDGSHTFFIDAVKQEFSKSSTSKERFAYEGNVIDMFRKIRT